MSEPYSEEMADSEAARQLLEFGDDYRNYLDSQSDGASSLSANHIPSPVRRRRPTVSYFLVTVVVKSSIMFSLRNVLCVMQCWEITKCCSNCHCSDSCVVHECGFKYLSTRNCISVHVCVMRGGT
jgi:hypothetical protein